jgi:hypothetical protein
MQEYDLGSRNSHFEVADVNGDGWLDVIVGDEYGLIRYFEKVSKEASLSAWRAHPSRFRKEKLTAPVTEWLPMHTVSSRILRASASCYSCLHALREGLV